MPPGGGSCILAGMTAAALERHPDDYPRAALVTGGARRIGQAICRSLAAEGWALIEMARRLDEARKGNDNAEEVLALVRTNWRIWTMFQAALLDPESPVPLQIRENLLSLSNFIDKRSVELIADYSADKVMVLVNINRQIGAGLMGNPSDDPEEAERLRREHAEKMAAEEKAAEAAAANGEDADGTDHQV